jgi:hypothetical protein
MLLTTVDQLGARVREEAFSLINMRCRVRTLAWSRGVKSAIGR